MLITRLAMFYCAGGIIMLIFKLIRDRKNMSLLTHTNEEGQSTPLMTLKEQETYERVKREASGVQSRAKEGGGAGADARRRGVRGLGERQRLAGAGRQVATRQTRTPKTQAALLLLLAHQHDIRPSKCV